MRHIKNPRKVTNNVVDHYPLGRAPSSTTRFLQQVASKTLCPKTGPPDGQSLRASQVTALQV